MSKKMIHISMTKEEFMQRFAGSILKNTYSNQLDHHAEDRYWGRVKTKNGFYFFFKKAYVINSLSIFLKGRITETDGGIRIDYKFTKNIFVLVHIVIIALAFLLTAIVIAMDGSLISVLLLAISAGLFLAVFIKPKKSIERLEKKLFEIIQY